MAIGLSISAVIIAILIGTFVLKPRRTPDLPSGAIDPGAYTGLREIFFGTDASSISPEVSTGSVYGAAFEIGFPPGTATVVALADGTASLYLETGGGIIGAGRHESVHIAATAFVAHAEEYLELGDATATSPPLPENREVRFHWLTTNGVRSAAATELELEHGKHPLSGLYRQGQGLLECIRMASAPVAG